MTIEMYVALAFLFVVAMGVSHFVGWRAGVEYGSRQTTLIFIEHASKVFRMPPMLLAKRLRDENEAELNQMRAAKKNG